jgi:hypothetical protein
MSLNYNLQSTSDIFFSHDCSECHRPTKLANTLEYVFTGNALENLTFKQQILTGRCELVTTIKSSEEFTDTLLEKLLLLLHYSFTVTQQAMFLKKLKCNLQSSKFVVLCDSAENYSFMLQDEA